jgi:hypothetical protein
MHLRSLGSCGRRTALNCGARERGSTSASGSPKSYSGGGNLKLRQSSDRARRRRTMGDQHASLSLSRSLHALGKRATELYSLTGHGKAAELSLGMRPRLSALWVVALSTTYPCSIYICVFCPLSLLIATPTINARA